MSLLPSVGFSVTSSDRMEKLMKNLTKLLALLLVLTLLVGSLFSCDFLPGNSTVEPPSNDDNTPSDELGELVDYVANVKLDMTSDRLRTEATVRYENRNGEKVYTGFVDGDTTHFVVPKSVTDTGVLKARYIAINTPESTGQIEPWGKAASNFTKSKLSEAESIILESNTSRWDLDSTGDRYLVWVWYKTADMDDYRNLNLEIMQEGLAFASSYTDFVYADACRDILMQARAHKLHVHDKNTKDPDFYYGSARPVTLKELKTNIGEYVNTRVCFEAVVVRNTAQTAYVEEYDEATDAYFGMQVYYGFNLDTFGQRILQVGNRVLIVGSVQYYEAGGTYQISDIYYYPSIPDHEDNIQKISGGNAVSYQVVDAKTLLNGKIDVEISKVDDDGNETTETKTLDYGFVAMHSTKTLENLTIVDTYTTDNGGKNDGAISITCRAQDGTTIVLRTVVLYKDGNALVTEDDFPAGKVVNAKGIVDCYNGAYQLKIFRYNDIEFVQ